MSVTTRDRVKARAGLTGATHDTAIDEIVAAVSEAFARETDRTLVRASGIVVRLDGGPARGGALTVLGPLEALPIESISEVKEDTNPVDFAAVTPLVVEEDYSFEAETGLVYRMPPDATWTRGRGNVQITYTGGYVAAGVVPTGSQVGMPDDLIEMATRQAVAWFRSRSKPGIESLSVGGGSASLRREALLPEVRRVLARYRRMIV